eukprot:1158413-Pelagomonas_calceolata.AAC.3
MKLNRRRGAKCTPIQHAQETQHHTVAFGSYTGNQDWSRAITFDLRPTVEMPACSGLEPPKGFTPWASLLLLVLLLPTMPSFLCSASAACPGLVVPKVSDT